MEAPTIRSRPRDWWPAVIFVLHLAHGGLFFRLYPHAIQDPDLLAYFVYFRNWLTGSTALHSVPYFTVPKALLVFGLGPLGDASLAFACTALASAALGSLVYLAARDAFGRTTGVLLSLFLLLDVEKATLTLRSSADLWVAVFLFATIYFSTVRRLAASAVALLLAALVKPVALPCTAHFLALPGTSLRRRWAYALVPLAAIPLILASNQALLGTPFGPERFFAGFDALGEGTPIRPDEVLHFVAWTWLVKDAFVATAPWGVLGLVLWLGRDRRRLTEPFFLVPVLFLIGYLLLSVVTPYVPFFRFFWPVKIWFAAFIVFGMVETGRRVVRGAPWLRVAATAALLVFLADDYLVRNLSYQDRFARPFEDAMAFVTTTPDTLHREWHAGETILAPLAFMPYLVWQLGIDGPGKTVLIAEEAATANEPVHADWILFVPSIFARHGTREFVSRLAGGGSYELRVTDGTAALLALPSSSRALAYGRAP
jgi:hypothetical protein